ncbi:hypothetical protein BDW75DRAFT_234236 [Aspergillus navahoensis]
MPSVAQCAVHLKLLHAINRLRRDILNSQPLDEALNIKPELILIKKKIYQPKEIRLEDKTFAKRREAKWDLYLHLAVGRFLVWLKRMDNEMGQYDSNDASYLKLAFCPPLDVLLVWHSALLNPAWFQAYCQINEVQRMRRVLFPWPAINLAIDIETWKFALPEVDVHRFQQTTLHNSDLFDYLLKPKPDSLPDIITMYEEVESKRMYTAVRQLMEAEWLLPPHDAFARTADLLRGEGMQLIMNHLFEAVGRQGKFVDKMVSHTWIRSSAIEGTLTRAIERYGQFVHLMKLYPGAVLVPTLDIDLAWHTHQCSAMAYENSMNSLTGRFINHNDKIGSGKLNKEFDKTAVLYRQHFGLDYFVCICWECQAVLSAIERLDDIEGVDMAEITNQVVNELIDYRKAEIDRRMKKST